MDYNKFFSIEDQIGVEITEAQFHCLMADGKIWVTSCRMNGFEASKAMNKPLTHFAIDEREYGGSIVADTFVLADKIALARGFGEKVVGTLCGLIPYDHEFISASAIVSVN